jgi:hypothetical protein
MSRKHDSAVAQVLVEAVQVVATEIGHESEPAKELKVAGFMTAADEQRPIDELVKDVSWLLQQSEAFLIGLYGNKSNAIRGLALMNGGKCGPIAKALNIRFQHARNVLLKPLKREIKAEREAAKIKTA